MGGSGYVGQSLCCPSPRSTNKGGRAVGWCRPPVRPGPALLSWHSQLSEAHADVPLPKPRSVLSLTVLKLET